MVHSVSFVEVPLAESLPLASFSFSREQVAASFTGPLDSLMAKSMVACDSEGPTVIHVTKLFPTEDAQGFQAFGRVMSGTVKVGMQVKVLGEGYSPEDEEDMTTQQVQNVWVGESRCVVAVSVCRRLDLCCGDIADGG